MAVLADNKPFMPDNGNGLWHVLHPLLCYRSPFLAQVVCFACFSILSIFAVRPVAMKYLHRGEEERKSNADALEGREGVIIEEVQPQRSGYVKVDGDEWRAVSADGSLIKRGEKVRIVKMESIVATVERV